MHKLYVLTFKSITHFTGVLSLKVITYDTLI